MVCANGSKGRRASALPLRDRRPVAARWPWASCVALPELPAGWRSAVDPTYGCIYYFHEATGKTQWELPGST